MDEGSTGLTDGVRAQIELREIEQRILDLLTPENVRLGHTWLKRLVRDEFKLKRN